ncbi:type 1 pili tip component [Salinisphaera sp. T31B1]|uniref:type 1 pili tip component n=1 Tax=Salinisphaera sp. T31B1 TaxID=727963 RepID=UPI003342570D
MKVNELVAQWQANAGEQRTDATYEIRLPLFDAAKVAALCDLFPGLTQERILTDLLAAALDELASSFSYEPGDQVAAYDEQGDPMYADAGLTPRFQALAKAYAEELQARGNGTPRG